MFEISESRRGELPDVYKLKKAYLSIIVLFILVILFLIFYPKTIYYFSPRNAFDTGGKQLCSCFGLAKTKWALDSPVKTTCYGILNSCLDLHEISGGILYPY